MNSIILLDKTEKFQVTKNLEKTILDRHNQNIIIPKEFTCKLISHLPLF